MHPHNYTSGVGIKPPCFKHFASTAPITLQLHNKNLGNFLGLKSFLMYFCGLN